MTRKLHLLLWCVAAAILAFVALDYWSARNAPLYKKFEASWREDVALLEGSGKLPKAWFDVGKVEIIGGTPESRNWLRRIKAPVTPKKKEGGHNLEVLVVAWEEEGKQGVLVQYNLVDLKSRNMVWELGRTLILKGNQ